MGQDSGASERVWVEGWVGVLGLVRLGIGVLVKRLDLVEGF